MSDHVQGQLWNAGPVRTYASKKRTAAPLTCRHPGCVSPRRAVQGARYCEAHATMVASRPRRMREATCIGCGSTFEQPHTNSWWTPTREAWHDFCGDCHYASPLSLSQLKQHRVPARLVREWLLARDELACSLCARKLFGTRRPSIDHDHACCRGRVSCGGCVRGVVCSGCNNTLAGFERLAVRGIGREQIAAYLAPRAA